MRGHSHVVECIAFSHPNAEAVISGRQALEQNNHNEEKVDDSGISGIVRTNGLGNHNKKLDEKIEPPRYIVSGARDKNIVIWSLKSGMAMMTLKGHENWVRGVLFHPCGRFLISCADDQSIRVWDLAHQRERESNSIKQPHDNSFVSCIDWHPGRDLLASGSPNKEVKLWNYDPKKY